MATIHIIPLLHSPPPPPSSWWVLASSDRSFQTFLFSASSFQFFTFITFIFLHTSSSYLILGLPVCWLLIAFHSNIIFIILEESILCMWLDHQSSELLKNLTLSVQLIKQLSAALLHILQVFFPVWSGPELPLKCVEPTFIIFIKRPCLRGICDYRSYQG